MEAIALDADDRPSVFLIEHETDGTVARRLDVEVHGSVGTHQRITSEGLEEGKQIVLRGASYLQDGERVSVTR
jgi:fructose-specific phosphotransferase system component IIB